MIEHRAVAAPRKGLPPRIDDVEIRFSRVAPYAAFFYYGGHAMQFAGINYLMPVDAKRMDDILGELQRAKDVQIRFLPRQPVGGGSETFRPLDPRHVTAPTEARSAKRGRSLQTRGLASSDCGSRGRFDTIAGEAA
ncbi:MAG: hypothetical protein ACLPKB_35740 [Xanthobacteraceae bacterium]